MKKWRGVSTVVLAVMSVLAVASSQAKNDNIVPGFFIVTLRQEVNVEEVTRDHGLVPDAVFTRALRGFAGALPAAKLAALRADPRVRAVEPDRVVSLVHPVKIEAVATTAGETLPTGVDRIDAEMHPRTDVSGVGIAIIDTGIWKTHSDLNVVGGYNCTSVNTANWTDDNGHGTHVAGIAAAKAGNDLGVRGVAPNARLYAVKVLNKSGSGNLSWIIKGIDWVTANAASKNIRVANMSLGFEGTSAALDAAISNSVAAGVTYVVAAGNSAKDASTFSPANHPLVITVSAIADSNGRCGGGGPSTGYGDDDTFASFSNWGSPVDLAAPGVNIYSTYLGSKENPNGGYATMSGTSMAAPHVAGAAAQYLASNPSATPAAVREALRANGIPQSIACVGSTGNGGFTGDPDHAPGDDTSALAEPLVYVPGL
jgi:subtilisin family serine protease